LPAFASLLFLETTKFKNKVAYESQDFHYSNIEKLVLSLIIENRIWINTNLKPF
jgi:hypothetical protein